MPCERHVSNKSAFVPPRVSSRSSKASKSKNYALLTTHCRTMSTPHYRALAAGLIYLSHQKGRRRAHHGGVRPRG
jgi:hypothetical protein